MRRFRSERWRSGKWGKGVRRRVMQERVVNGGQEGAEVDKEVHW